MKDPELLNGWKQIAALFDVNRQTILGWHKLRPMPIVRVRGRVYAFKPAVKKWFALFKLDEQRGEDGLSSKHS